MRLIAWNCNMAFHRKGPPMMALRPDVAVVSECAAPEVLIQRGYTDFDPDNVIWMGKNPNKGLAVFGFNGYRVTLADPFYAYLRYILPVRVTGPRAYNLLGVWAQNASAGLNRKHQQGPMRRAMTKYRDFLAEGPSFIAGDLNNSVYWDKPGWRSRHDTMVGLAKGLDMVSGYHHARGEAQGAELEPTHYWRDRKKDGPTYHIDYIFVPTDWAGGMREMSVGTFEEWCGNKLSDHVPLVVEV